MRISYYSTASVKDEMKCAWGIAGMMLKREKRSTQSKILPIAPLSTTNPTWTTVGLNQGFYSERLAVNRCVFSVFMCRVLVKKEAACFFENLGPRGVGHGITNRKGQSFSLLGLFLHHFWRPSFFFLLRAASKSTKESLEECGLRDGEINS